MPFSVNLKGFPPLLKGEVLLKFHPFYNQLEVDFAKTADLYLDCF